MQAATQYQVAVHLNALNNVIYKDIKANVKNNWAINSLNSVSCSINEAIKKADAYVDPKTDQHATNSQGLAFTQ